MMVVPEFFGCKRTQCALLFRFCKCFIENMLHWLVASTACVSPTISHTIWNKANHMEAAVIPLDYDTSVKLETAYDKMLDHFGKAP